MIDDITLFGYIADLVIWLDRLMVTGPTSGVSLGISKTHVHAIYPFWVDRT